MLLKKFRANKCSHSGSQIIFFKESKKQQQNNGPLVSKFYCRNSYVQAAYKLKIGMYRNVILDNQYFLIMENHERSRYREYLLFARLTSFAILFHD